MTWCGRSVVISALLAAGAVGRLAAQAPPGATLPPIGSRVRVTLPRAPDDPRRPGIPLPSARVEGTLLRADTTGLALRILGRFERDYPAAQVLRLEVPRPGRCSGAGRRAACALAGTLAGAAAGVLFMEYGIRSHDDERARSCSSFPDQLRCDYAARRRLGAAVGGLVGLTASWGVGRDRWTPSPAWPPAPR